MIAPTTLNLFFVQEMLKPASPLAWRQFKSRCRSAAYHVANLEKRRIASRGRREKNPEREGEIARRHREKPDSKAVRREYVRKRMTEDRGYKLLHNLRNRIRFALKLNLKAVKTAVLVGMEIKEFRIYLQGQFLPGMTWENYGPVWHIDHIRPCASFDLTDPAQQSECFNWSNCQPLFAEDNLKKGANGG